MKQNVSDLFWDEWAQSLSSLPTFSTQFERYTTDTMRAQEEWFTHIKEDLQMIEREMKQYERSLRADYKDYATQFHEAPFTEPLQEWPAKWRHLSERIHKASVHPAQISLALLSQEEDQFAKMWQQLTTQHEKQHREVKMQMQAFLQESKQLQRHFIQKKKRPKNC